MSIPTPQLQVLRTVFQSCRPRSSLRLRTASNVLLRHNQIRCHATETSTPFTSSPASSVSQEEVSHFSRLASSWWDPYGPSRLLHLMNPLRHDFISSCLRSDANYDPNTKLSYLDIGCGGGIFASSAARRPHTEKVTAIDPTPEVIAVAKAQQRSDPALAEPKLTYLNCAIEDLAKNTQPESQLTSQSEPNSSSTKSSQQPQYDILTLFEVIEHISEPSAFLTNALNHLKPGGWLIGSTISRHPIAYLTTILAAEAPLIGVVPRGTHDWNKYIKPGELKAWVEKQNILSRDKIIQKETDSDIFGKMRIEGVIYVPIMGWRFVKGSEEVGNYFFGVQKLK